MPKEVMRRQASDNEYLHKDFHGAMSVGIDYLEENYGPDAVTDYLQTFARTFYAPLTKALGERGLVALKEHFERIYALECADVDVTMTDDELVIRVSACPAVTHMRKQGRKPARLFHETTRTVNSAICEGTPFAAELLDYDPETGSGVQRFYRRQS